MEYALPAADYVRMAYRFCNDALFRELAMPVFVASIDAAHARNRIERAEEAR